MKPSKAAVITTVVLVCFAGLAQSAPKPSDVPFTWQLEIRIPGPPQPIRVQAPGKSRPETFWFLRYTITNRTGRDQVFVPDFVLYTDTGQLIRAGRGVPGAVFEKIKKTFGNDLLRDKMAMTGKLLQGAGLARDGVAIWRDIDANAAAIDIFVGGLSGETAEVTLPVPISLVVTDLKTGRKKTVKKNKAVLNKTLRLHYNLPGDVTARFRILATLISKTWVMR